MCQDITGFVNVLICEDLEKFSVDAVGEGNEGDYPLGRVGRGSFNNTSPFRVLVCICSKDLVDSTSVVTPMEVRGGVGSRVSHYAGC